MDLATLRSTPSSVTNYSSSNSTLQNDSEETSLNTLNVSNTIQSFNLDERIVETEDNLETPFAEDNHTSAVNDSDILDDLDKDSDKFVIPEAKVVRGSGPRALRRRPGKPA